MELTSSQKWTELSPNSGLPAFHVIPYHACRKALLNLQTFFVFPNADEEMEDEKDKMETDEDIQDEATLEGEVSSNNEEDNSR
jgi:hypothetical protein